MRSRVPVVALVAVLALAGCSTATPAVPRPTRAASSQASSAPATTAAAIPSPDDNQRIALITGLQKVDPGLVEDPDAALTYGRNVCQYVLSGDDAAGYAVSRAAADGTTITAAQGAAVVAAVQSSFCS